MLLYKSVRAKKTVGPDSFTMQQRNSFFNKLKYVVVSLLLLLSTGSFNPIYALNQTNNWNFASDASSWSTTNGSGTDTCGNNTSSNKTSMATFAFDGTSGNPAGSFKAVSGTTASTDYRGEITQTFTVPSSGNVKVKGQFDYSASSTGFGGANSSYVRLDIYDSANSTYVGNLGCASFNTNQNWTTTSMSSNVTLTGGTTYTIRMNFRALTKSSSPAAITLWVDNILVTLAPTGLTTSAPAATTNAALSWTTSSGGSGAAGLNASTPYKVYRDISSPVSSFLANATTNSYTDSTTSPNTTYYYAISDVDTNSVESPLSAESSLLTLPGAPGTPTITNDTGTALTVSWTAPTGGASSYKVERCTGSGCSNFSQIASGVTTTSYNDSGLTGSTVYLYRVRATNTTGDSGYSSTGQETTASTTTNTSSSSSSTSSTTSAPGPPQCAATVPAGTAPLLYSTEALSSDTILLKFANWQTPTDHFVLEYGTATGTYVFGVSSFGDAKTTSYTVTFLQPNTTYFFRIMAGNGCATGSWSNEASVRTPAISIQNTHQTTPESMPLPVPSPFPTPTMMPQKIQPKQESQGRDALLFALETLNGVLLSSSKTFQNGTRIMQEKFLLMNQKVQQEIAFFLLNVRGKNLFVIGNIKNSLNGVASTIVWTTESSLVSEAFIANTLKSVLQTAKESIANVAFVIGEKTQSLSDGIGYSIIQFGYLFFNEPTKISRVRVVQLTATTATISWTTNHPANGKINYGTTSDYGEDVQSKVLVTNHEFTLTNLQPHTTYFYEVMSQNRTYIYDANHTFITPGSH